MRCNKDIKYFDIHDRWQKWLNSTLPLINGTFYIWPQNAFLSDKCPYYPAEAQKPVQYLTNNLEVISKFVTDKNSIGFPKKNWAFVQFWDLDFWRGVFKVENNSKNFLFYKIFWVV